MGISERKEREKIELRELILLKAKEILSKEGQDQLSIRKIATAAEYSPATIYLYFKDKDEILFSLMEMGFTLMGKFLMEAISEPDPVKRIAAIGRGYVRFGIDNPDWYELMFNSEKPMNHLERCKEVWGQGLSLFELLVSTCQEVIDSRRTRGNDPHHGPPTMEQCPWTCQPGPISTTGHHRKSSSGSSGGSHAGSHHELHFYQRIIFLPFC
ncbi:MAG: TetR/AcrR family transcriptional regulator [Saprospiraceae bacterium]|nr:TetR/AcrR family transcriptional regulator [Candidatus Vicinibacter affinis]